MGESREGEGRLRSNRPVLISRQLEVSEDGWFHATIERPCVCSEDLIAIPAVEGWTLLSGATGELFDPEECPFCTRALAFRLFDWRT